MSSVAAINSQNSLICPFRRSQFRATLVFSSMTINTSCSHLSNWNSFKKWNRTWNSRDIQLRFLRYVSLLTETYSQKSWANQRIGEWKKNKGIFGQIKIIEVISIFLYEFQVIRSECWHWKHSEQSRNAKCPVNIQTNSSVLYPFACPHRFSTEMESTFGQRSAHR
jgi:hypothetical protein